MPKADLALVEFYQEPVLLKKQTELKGYPVYQDRDYVRIMFPGLEKVEEHVREVKPEDKVKWANQWQAYQKNQEQPVEGTPLSQWPQVTPAELRMLQSHGFRTVEQLAEAHDGQLIKIHGAHQLQKRAHLFLDELKPAAHNAAVTDRTEVLVGEAASLKQKAEGSRVGTDDQANGAGTLRNTIGETIKAITAQLDSVKANFAAKLAVLEQQRDSALAGLQSGVDGLEEAQKLLNQKLDVWDRERARAMAEGGSAGISRMINTPDNRAESVEFPAPPPSRKNVTVSAEAQALADGAPVGGPDSDDFFEVDTSKGS